MEGRLVFRNDEERGRARRLGITDFDRIYSLAELAGGDLIFAATGVTDGWMLAGVHRTGSYLSTQSIVMRSKTGTVRLIEASRNLAHDPGP